LPTSEFESLCIPFSPFGRHWTFTDG
jgi:hypothetical protein